MDLSVNSTNISTCHLLPMCCAVMVVCPAIPAQPRGAPGDGGGARGGPAAIVPQDPATLKRDIWGHPDLNGMWDNQYTPNIATAVVGGGDSVHSLRNATD